MDYDGLEKLVKLRDLGALSDEEFAEQKRILAAKWEGSGIEQVRDFATPPVRSPLRVISVTLLAAGLFAVVYSTFIYDNTISPVEARSAYSSVDESSSLEDKARAIDDISDRFNRTLAGERIINYSSIVCVRVNHI